MGLNTYPYSPFPGSTEQLHKGDNEQIQAEIDVLQENVSELSDHVDGDAVTYPYADVITIEDAVPANVADCNVKIELMQDLHGYDKPWVGGAGKNQMRFPYTNDSSSGSYGGITATVNDDGSIRFAGTASTDYYFKIHTDDDKLAIKAGTWTVSSANTIPAYIGVYVGSTYLNNQNLTRTLTYAEDTEIGLYVMIPTSAGQVDFTLKLQLEAGDQATAWAPYENICPISGHTEAMVTVADDDTDPTVTNTYTLALGDTIYGGTVDFDSGVMTVTMAQIASYDGETIGEPWISDQDVYAAETTPTTGAQVVYTLATPTTIQLTRQQIQLLKGTNTLTASTGDISVTVNGVSGAIGSMQEQANTTDAALAELAADIAEQLPTAPTTDGAYVLTVTVASGTPTYSWESAE